LQTKDVLLMKGFRKWQKEFQGGVADQLQELARRLDPATTDPATMHRTASHSSKTELHL